MMKYLSQRDPKWSRVKVGSSPWTIREIGCLISCVSMLSDYFGVYMPPDEIARRGSFTPAGLFYWSSVARLFKTGFRFTKRVYRYDKAIIEEHLNDPDKAVILQVDGHTHFVVAVRDPKFSDDYLVADPLSGLARMAIGDFEEINGMACFERVK